MMENDITIDSAFSVQRAFSEFCVDCEGLILGLDILCLDMYFQGVLVESSYHKCSKR